MTDQTRVTVTCPDCHQPREVAKNTSMTSKFTGRCSSCSKKHAYQLKYPGPVAKKMEVTCPDCKQTRMVNRATTQCGGYTGRCITCSRKRIYERKHPEKALEQPSRKGKCLKCDVEIPYNPALRLCEVCRATNTRIPEHDRYGRADRVRPGYRIW